MLTKLVLTNFRGFQQHEVPFKDLTILVGRNNAGKSSLVEALRISSVAAKALLSSRSFLDCPRWASSTEAAKGVSPDASRLMPRPTTT